MAGYGILLLLSTAWHAWGQAAAQPPDAETDLRRTGVYLRVTAPITDAVDRRVRQTVETTMKQARQSGQWPVFILEIEGGRTQLGQALDLARYLSGPELSGARTAAYLPKSVSGHSVLVALACDEIIMSPDASLGNAGEFEPAISPLIHSAYVEVANRRRTVPSDVALALVDPDVELYVVETDVSREFVVAERLDDLRREKVVKSAKVLKPAGRPGVIEAEQARELGFVSYLARDKADVAKALGLARHQVEALPTADGQWRTMRVEVTGELTAQKVERIQNMIQAEIRQRGVNFVCLDINSPGGSPVDCQNLANMLARFDPEQVRTVAFIPAGGEALGAAAFIALACDQIVMAPDAQFGGGASGGVSKDDVAVVTRALRELASQKGRSPTLAAALVDRSLAVYRFSRKSDGVVDYFTQDEMDARADKDDWQRGKQVVPAERVLHVNGHVAEELHLAWALAANLNEFRQLYHLDDDPALVEPGWADYLVRALNSDGVRVFVLMLGFVALVAELQSPGIGVGGFVATVCFMLFFWSSYLGGTADWLEAMLFVCGIIFILVEIFVLPGVGIFGLGGGLMVIAAIILASQTFIIPRNESQLLQLRNSVLLVAAAGAGAVALAAVLHRVLPRVPVVNRMLLEPPSGEELSELSRREAVAMFDHLQDAVGTAITRLMPAGKARFGDELVDVITDGEYIDRGQSVRVVQVRGNRVLVRSVGSVS